jgi:hypothetical protein
MKKVLVILALSTLCIYCSSPSGASGSISAPSTQSDGKYFGEKISETGAISYMALLQVLGQTDSVATKVKGTVTSVCQAKGCWLKLTSEGGDHPEMMVKFKDYGFFMPKDIAGRQVVLQGIAYREVTSVDELRHYAEDAGKSAEEIQKITAPKEELKFMAAGAVLLDK